VSWLLALSTIVTILAWMVARRRPDHRPIALFLTVALAADLARWPLRLFVLLPAHDRFGSASFSGWWRVAGHLESALFLTWSAGIAAVAQVVFVRRRFWPVVAAWAIFVALLAIGYPTIRGAVLARFYLGAELVALAVAIGALVQWFWTEEPSGIQHTIVMLLIGVDLVVVIAGAWRHGIFASWNLAQISYSVLYFLLLALNGLALWLAPTSSSRSPR